MCTSTIDRRALPASPAPPPPAQWGALQRSPGPWGRTVNYGGRWALEAARATATAMMAGVRGPRRRHCAPMTEACAGTSQYDRRHARPL